jgi:Icc-related predicted phosphoesterase
MGGRVVFGVVGDAHARLRHLEDACAALETEGSLAAVLRVLERMRALSTLVRRVPGNHDLPTLPDEPRFAGNPDGRLEDLAGVRIAGFGGAGTGQVGLPCAWSDEAALRRGIPARDPILAHAPPHGPSLDLARGLRGEVQAPPVALEISP